MSDLVISPDEQRAFERQALRYVRRACAGIGPELFRVWPTIVADPPWPYDDPGIRGGVDHHYDVMSVDAIAALPVWRYVAAAGHLYLWIPNAHILEGVGARVCRAWGFEPKTVITWDKMLIGTGHYYRNQTEHAIFAVRGTSPIQVRDLPTIIRHRRLGHSEKPPEFYYMVEEASPGPYLELFARRQRGLGWSCWGNELARPVRLPELDAAASPPARVISAPRQSTLLLEPTT